MIFLEFNTPTFRKNFGKLLAKAKDATGMLQVCGRQVANDLKAHFRNKDAMEPNKLGGRRTHYWNRVAGSVNQPQIETATRISVTIFDPTFAQKVFGGTIRAKKAKALTIPLTKEAYGRTAGDFPGAFVIRTPKGAFIVKHGETFTGTGRISTAKVGKYRIKAALNFLFKLVPSVDQERDEFALPEMQVLEQSVIRRGQAYLDMEGEVAS